MKFVATSSIGRNCCVLNLTFLSPWLEMGPSEWETLQKNGYSWSPKLVMFSTNSLTWTSELNRGIFSRWIISFKIQYMSGSFASVSSMVTLVAIEAEVGFTAMLLFLKSDLLNA